MNHVGVIGCGAWASTIASLIADQHDVPVHVWCHDEALAAHINSTNKHPQFDIYFPGNVKASTDLESVIKASSHLILGVASPYLSILKDIALYYASQPLLILTKGVVERTDDDQPASMFVSDHVRHYLPTVRLATLSGPNLAAEIQDKKPAATVIASDDLSIAESFQTFISCARFRVYTSQDQRGVEMGGVLKNYVAVACGISEGLQLGANCRAALITRGLQEMIRFGQLFGGKEQTFYGLSGMGDLIATCSSSSSRNYRLGFAIASGKSVEEALSFLRPQVAEGYKTTKIVYAKAKEEGLDLPLVQELYDILYNKKSPQASMQALAERPSRQE